MSVTSAYVELAAVGDQFVQEHDKNSLFGLAQDADPGVFAFVLLAKGFDHGFSALVGQVQLDGTASFSVGRRSISPSASSDLDRLETAALLMPVELGGSLRLDRTGQPGDEQQPEGGP